MELHISGFQDLNQLQGFTITAMDLQRLEDNTPVIHMQLKSPYYEKAFEVKFFPTVEMQVKGSGRHIEAVPGISMRGKHVDDDSASPEPKPGG